MKQFFIDYLKSDSDVGSKRANVAYFIIFFTILAVFGIFTKTIVNERIYDLIVDACLVIIIGGTLGVTAVDVVGKLKDWNRKKPVEPTPEPVQIDEEKKTQLTK